MLAAAVTICVMNGASQTSVTNNGSNLDAMIATRSVLVGACNFDWVAGLTRRNGSLNPLRRIT